MSKHTIQRHPVNVVIPIGVDTSQSLSSVAGNVVPPGSQNFPDAILQLARQMEQLRAVHQSASDTVAANTQAITQNTAVQGNGKGVGSAIGSAASSLLGNVLSALPLVSELTRLFRGSTPNTPPTLLPYIQPAPIHFDQTVSTMGQAQSSPAPYQPPSTGGSANQLVGLNTILTSTAMENLANQQVTQSTAKPSGGGGDTEPMPGQTAPRTAPSISIQVNAMDSRSFLDHSHDIALAVRDAMLNMNALNDVVNDL